MKLYTVKDVEIYKMPKKTVTKYWKYGTTPNADIIGSPTINNGIASNFSSSNYIQSLSNFNALHNTWEIVTRLKLDSLPSQESSLFGIYEGLYLSLLSSGDKLVALFYNSAGSYFGEIESQSTFNLNTWYYVRLRFTGTGYIFQTSTTGEFSGEEVTEGTLNSTMTIGQGYPIQFGYCGYGTVFNGEIDLTKTYAKINGQDWWHATLFEQATPDDYEFTTTEDIYYASTQGAI